MGHAKGRHSRDGRWEDVGEGLGEMRSCDSFEAISVTAPGKIEDFGRFWVELCHFSGKNCHSSASRVCKITEN